MRRFGLKVVVGCVVLCLPSGLLLSQPPDAFESLLAAAQQAQARSDFQGAADFYRQAVILHPDSAELRTNLGLMYYQIGKSEQAANAFRQAIRLKPALFVPNLFLGLDYVRLKRFRDAVPYLQTAVLSKPRDAQTQLGLGEAYAGTGETRLAIASYLRAMQIAPENADAWYHLGVSYLEQVEADARILLTRHKNSGYLRALVADNLADQRTFGAAAEAYKNALMSSTFPAGTHASYGFVLIHQHDLDAAERELNTELKQNPGSLIAKLGIARLRVERGTVDEAANGLAEIGNSDVGFFRANIAKLKAGMSQSAASKLQQILEQKEAAGDLSVEAMAAFDNDSASEWRDQHTVSGRTFAAESPKSRSIAADLYASGKYRQCTDLLASRARMLRSEDLRVLAFCAFSTGDYRQAFDASARLALIPATEAEGLYWETKSAQRLATQALERASEMDPGSPKLHVLLGDLYRQRKFFPSAEQEYRKALALAPHDTGALFGLSLALLANDQIDEAFQITQAALKNASDDPELNAMMGEILCAGNDFVGAEPYLKKGLNTKPEYVPHVHALLGKVYARTGRTELAIAELKFALAEDKDGTLHYQIARLYLKVGDRDSAKQALDASQRLRTQGLNRATVFMQQGEDDSESQ